MTQNGDIQVFVTNTDELQKYLKDNLREVHNDAGNKEFKHSPNWEMLKHLERKGRHVSLVAIKDKRVVGFLGAALNEHLHYSENMFCLIHLVYLEKELRGTNHHFKLLKKLEELLVDFNIDRIDWGCPFKPSLPEGWGELETVYSKRL